MLLRCSDPRPAAAGAWSPSPSPRTRVRPWLVPVGRRRPRSALTVCAASAARRRPRFGGWLVLDPLGRLRARLPEPALPALLALRAGLPARAARPAATASSARPCSPSWRMMTLIVLSHHLGLMWVAIEATTLCRRPLLYFNRNPRSLEATWKYLLIGSVGIALALLGSFFLAYSALHGGLRAPRCCSRTWCATPRGCRGPGCTPPSCCCSSATAPRWAWRPCTPGSPTPTARRPGWWARCWPGGSPTAPSWRCCASSRSARPPARRAFARELLVVHRPAVDGGGRRVHGPAARLQAHARLLQRRAHGHPGARRRPRRQRHLRRAAAPAEQRPRQGRAVPLGRATSTGPTAASSPTTCRARSGALPVVGRAVPGRLLRHHRLAALRPVRQRVHHPARRGGSGHRWVGGAVPGACWSSCSWAWGPRCSESSRASRRRGSSHVAVRDGFLTVARRSCCWPWCSCWASTCRRRCSRWSGEAAAFLEVRP